MAKATTRNRFKHRFSNLHRNINLEITKNNQCVQTASISYYFTRQKEIKCFFRANFMNMDAGLKQRSQCTYIVTYLIRTSKDEQIAPFAQSVEQ